VEAFEHYVSEGSAGGRREGDGRVEGVRRVDG